jgi:TonB family protein
MWVSVFGKNSGDLCRGRFLRVFAAIAAGMIALLACGIAGAASAPQDASPASSRIVRDQMDSLASRLAEQIRQSKIDPAYPKILVIDFSNASDKQFSKLGALLADDLAQSLAGFASGFQVQDRKEFSAYLKENWMGLEDLQNEVVCLTLARSMGGAGVVRGTIETEANQRLRISLRTDGLGTSWSGEAEFPATLEMQELLKQPAISFERSAETITVEPGILQPGVDGASLPVCVYCPSPDYTDLARTAKYRGTVELSLIVTKEGAVNSVVVLKGAPFSLTQKAIDTVQKWKFKPSKFHGQAVPVRVPVDIEFQLY